MTTVTSIPTSVTRSEDLEDYAQQALKAVDTIETYSLDKVRHLIDRCNYHRAEFQKQGNYFMYDDPFATENGLTGDVLPYIFPTLTIIDVYDTLSTLEIELTDEEQAFFQSIDTRLQAIASKL